MDGRITVKKSPCPKCNSRMTYVRNTTKEVVCRACGAISPLKASSA